MQNKLLDVVKHSATFFNSVQDGGKVVISKNNVRGFLSNIRASLAHGNTNISTLERRRVVDTISSHSDKALATVESFNHTDLGLGSTASDYQGQQRQCIDLIVCKLVKVDSSHDHSLGHVGSDLGYSAGQNSDLKSDSTGSFWVVSSEHVNAYTSLVALANRGSRFRSRWVVETDKTTEDKILFKVTTLQLSLILIDVPNICLASESKNTETKSGHGLHILQDVFLGAVGEVDDLVADGGLGARGQDTLDSTFGEDPLFIGLLIFKDDRHLFNIRIKGELGNLPPLGIRASGEAKSVPVESRGKDLDGNFSWVSSSVPFIFNFGHRGKVSQGGDIKVIPKSCVRFSELGALDNITRRVRGLKVDILGLAAVERDFTIGGVNRLVCGANRVSAAPWNPGLPDNHLALGEGTSLVGANIC
jgi:hypothetical protein